MVLLGLNVFTDFLVPRRDTKHIIVYLRITQGICGITFVICMTALFLSCVPISMFWSLFVTNSKFGEGLRSQRIWLILSSIERCTRRTLLTFTSGISNILTNTLVLAVPVPLLFRANLTLRERIGLSILYFFGGISQANRTGFGITY